MYVNTRLFTPDIFARWYKMDTDKNIDPLNGPVPLTASLAVDPYLSFSTVIISLSLISHGYL